MDETEYIKLTQPLPLDELATMAKAIKGNNGDITFIAPCRSHFSIAGVSDGRSPASSTFCFLEAMPSDEIKKRLHRCLVFTTPEVALSLDGVSLLLTQDPRSLFIDVLLRLNCDGMFHCFSSLAELQPEIHSHANIHSNAIIEEDVYIGKNSIIAAGCVIKKGTVISDNVTIRENSVIGSDGIALYKSIDGRLLRFPHLAGVIIDSAVEIGVGCVISRGVLKSTQIGEASVIGNLSNIGHSAKIGDRVWMSIGCLIGGNTAIGSKASLGLGVRIKDNLTIGLACNIGMGSAVVKSLPDNLSVFGNPARAYRRLKTGPTR